METSSTIATTPVDKVRHKEEKLSQFYIARFYDQYQHAHSIYRGTHVEIAIAKGKEAVLQDKNGSVEIMITGNNQFVPLTLYVQWNPKIEAVTLKRVTADS